MDNNEIELQEMVQLVKQIKNDILSTRNKVMENANQELLNMYFRIGKSISENATYGSKFIDNLSSYLKTEFPEATGYSPRNLSRMKRFYEEYKQFPILPPLVAKLPWSHNSLLIDKIDEIEKRMWYAEKTLENSWSKSVLDHQIELQLYERQSKEARKLTNFTSMLPLTQGELANDVIKDPYIFELTGLKEKVLEKDVEHAMIEKIKTVMLELGRGFSFVGNQYRISTENKDYFIDLLFYHLELRCYVVIELKTTDFDPSFVGQLQFYVTAVDETLKKDIDNPTIGLLLCRNKDRQSVEWALKAVNVPVGVASYEVRQYLPTDEEISSFISFKE